MLKSITLGGIHLIQFLSVCPSQVRHSLLHLPQKPEILIKPLIVHSQVFLIALKVTPGLQVRHWFEFGPEQPRQSSLQVSQRFVVGI